MSHFGLKILEVNEQDPRLSRFGAITKLDRIMLQSDRDWRPFLPTLEVQNAGGYDRMACVTYSALNCLETVAFRKFGVRLNLADRFTAKMSGTTREGNNFSDVAESIRKLHGVVPEESWPDTPAGWEEYYKEVAEEVVRLGKLFFEEWAIEYEAVWDTTDQLWEALQYAPLQVGIYAYGPEVNGIFQRSEARGNHAVSLVHAVEGQHWEIYDHYLRSSKNLAWNTRFWGCFRFDIKKKIPNPIPMYPFKNDTMYFVAEGRGEEFAFMAGKLYHDDPNKMSRQIAYRTKGATLGHYETIGKSALVGINAYSLKGEDLGPAINLA